MTSLDSEKEGVACPPQRVITATQLSTRWVTVLLAGLIMFGNHYARDAVGALEIQIETDLSITTDQYAMINSVYFIPSILSPILAGIFTNAIGGPVKCLLYSVISGAVGHIIFSLGIQFDNVMLMYIGRSLAGFMYEIIDSVPIVILAPLFDSQWGLIVGLINGFLRLGSVMNFLISPVLYKMKGVKYALWFATAAATSTILFAFLIYLYNTERVVSGSNSYEQLPVSSQKSSDGLDGLSDIEKGSIELSKADAWSPVHLSSISVDRKGSCETDCEADSVTDMDISPSPSSSPSDQQFSSPTSHWDDDKNTRGFISSDEWDDKESRSTSTVVRLSFITAYAKSTVEFLVTALPLHLFGYQYFMFLLSGAFLYGSMVPFWFLGSKFLQDSYSLSVGQADALMLFPEGMIAVVAVPVGVLLDRYNCSTKARLQMLALSCLLLPLSYTMLAEGYRFDTITVENPGDATGIYPVNVQQITTVLISPLLTMNVIGIGIAYAVSNSLYWGTVMDVLPEGHLSSANGLIASCLNILPSVVPPLLVFASSLSTLRSDVFPSFPLYFLSFLGFCASVFALLATLSSKIPSTQ